MARASGLLAEIDRIQRLRDTEGRGEYADISHKLGTSSAFHMLPSPEKMAPKTTIISTPRDPGKSTAMDMFRAASKDRILAEIVGKTPDKIIYDELESAAFKKEAFADFKAVHSTAAAPAMDPVMARRKLRRETCERIGKEWPHLRGRNQELQGVGDNWFTVTEQLSEIIHKSNLDRETIGGKHPEHYRQHVTRLVDNWSQADHDQLIEWIQYCERKAVAAYVVPVDDPVNVPNDLVEELATLSGSAARGVW